MSAPQLAPGTVVAQKYQLGACLGFAGSSATYQAVGSDGREVVLKLFDPGIRQRADIMAALEQTYAATNALPQDVAERLGLQMVRKAIVSHADDRRDELDVAAPVKVRIGDRHMTTECLVLPPMSEALIGQVVLETLDLIVDCQRQTLTPRPESPIYPSLKLK